MADWKSNKEFSAGYFRLWLLMAIYRLFGEKALKILLITPIACIAFLCMGKARAASYAYFKTLYEYTGDKRFKPCALKSFKHIYAFACSLVDKAAAWHGYIKESRLVYKNPETVQRFMDNLEQGKGIFILSSHLGNVEILRAIAATRDKKIQVNAFMDVAQTEQFNNFVQKNTPDAGLKLYSAFDISLEIANEMKERLKNGELVVMGADRSPFTGERRPERHTFLGKEAVFSKGPLRFMRLMEADFCFLTICANSSGGYDVYLKYFEAQDSASLDKVEEAYISNLQTLVLQYPYQWFNFYDFWS